MMTMTRRYGRVPLWAWLIFPVVVLVAGALLWVAVSTSLLVNFGVMPVAFGETDGRYAMGDLPCGKAYIETLHRRADSIDYAVWSLDDRVLAIVVIEGDRYTAYVDTDFNNRYDLVETGPSPTDKPVNDWYNLVPGCAAEGFTGAGPQLNLGLDLNHTPNPTGGAP